MVPEEHIGNKNECKLYLELCARSDFLYKARSIRGMIVLTVVEKLRTTSCQS